MKHYYHCVIANRNNPKNTPVSEYSGYVKADTRLEAIPLILQDKIGATGFDIADPSKEIQEFCEYYSFSPILTLETDSEYLFVLELEGE